MVFDCYVMNIIIFGTDRQINTIYPVTHRQRLVWKNKQPLLFNPFEPEFTIVIFIHYKPRIAVAILDL